MARISVIMGIYNCASTLVEALDSLYAQTYQDFKIILCEDGSTDNTYEVAEEYVVHHDNIILIRNEKNLKLASALNRCLEYVDTEYVARMDGDDVSLPTRFEKEVVFLDDHPEYALVSCPMIYFDESGDWMIGSQKEKPKKTDFYFGHLFCHAPMMMRTSVLKEVGGYTDEPWTIRCEDYYLWYKIYKAGYVGYNIQEPLYKMRDNRVAFRRRTIQSRWNFYKVSVKVKKSLGLKFPYLSGCFDLAKVLLPNSVLRSCRQLLGRLLLIGNSVKG